jgi:hypothetical protein
MTTRFLVEAKTASLSEWQNAIVILKELFVTEESLPVGIMKRFLVEAKTASLSE